MAASSVWAAAYECTFSLGSILTWTSFKLNISAGEFEVTNLNSPRSAAGKLMYEGGMDVITVAFTGTFVIDKNDLKTVAIGTKIDGVSGTLIDGRTFTGSLNITGQDMGGAAKGEYSVNVSGKFTGEVSGI